ncbi:MAG: hypothetical protein LBE77_00840 [Fluviicola sp.]|nr:hypothetical protein [Fluviicola sp.]
MILSIAALLLLQGCNNPQEKAGPVFLNFKLEKVKTLLVNDILTSASIDYQAPGSDWVYFIDPKTKTLLKVDVLNSSIKCICVLPDFDIGEERFSVNESKKEIYISSYEHIKVLSFDGSVKNSYKFADDYENGFIVQISNNFTPFIRNGKIYGHYVKDDDNSYKSPAFFQGPIQIEIDLKTKKINFSNVGYPISYRLKCYGMNCAPERLIFSKDEQLFAFAYNDTAYLYNEVLKESKPYFLGSHKKHSFEYIDFRDVKKLNENIFTEFYFQTKQYAFAKIAPLSGLILRTQLRQDRKTGKLIENLILYDMNFKYIGESKKGFGVSIIVDTKKGLYSLKLNSKTKCLEIYRLSW